MRIAFFGTPAFAVPALDALVREHEVALVVAQPDKPAGRGMKMQAPPVALRARELGLTLLQPPKIRNEEFLDVVRGVAPDVGIVVAYGKILPPALLAIPRHGFLNIHGSILPRWRGAAPIQRSIEAGDRVTGVTIMRVDEELDHGPMLAIAETAIGPDERTPDVAARLSSIGADALAGVLRDLENGTATETEQDHASATIAPKIDRSEGEIRFDEDAQKIYDRFRAFDPWPGISFTSNGENVKVLDARVSSLSGTPRTVLAIDDAAVTIACRTGALRITQLQRPNKPRMAATVVARSLGWNIGERVP